jgi:drug/metabolite transporter (DMT)-like permease
MTSLSRFTRIVTSFLGAMSCGRQRRALYAQPMSARIWIAYAVCCLGWGSTWMAVKIGLQDLPPLRFAAVRMALACALLTPFALRLRSGQLSRAQRRDIALVGLCRLAGCTRWSS